MRRLGRILRGSFVLAAAAWFGGIVMLVVALPVLFSSERIPRTTAAMLAGDILLVGDYGCRGALVVLWLTGPTSMKMAGTPRGIFRATLVLLVILSVSKLTDSFVARPAMDALLPQIDSFELDAPMTPARARFNVWHYTAEGLMTLDLLVLGALLWLSAGRRVGPPAQHPEHDR